LVKCRDQLVYTMEQSNEYVTYKTEVEVIISPQAQKALAGSKYTIKEFKDWALKDQKITLGGNNVIMFLENKYNEEARKWAHH